MPIEQLIYTDRPRGKGHDPNRSGYQIKACSDGLDSEVRDVLGGVCVHYGDAVYRYPPARERETAWRAQTQSLSEVPPEVLEAFPVVWSYDQLPGKLFSLSRICYSGLTHDKRLGNFFVHTLAFAPESLSAHGYNPLALSRVGLFKGSDSGDEVQLPSLPDFGLSTGTRPEYTFLRQASYLEHLAEMITALSVANPTTRPMVVCLADWRPAPQLVEALLYCLPPAARCRTTFCTYENDRSWLIPTRTGKPTGAAAHHLLILCGQNDQAFALRPDDYQTRYAVFNFVGNQFSPVETPRPYARFVADCITNDSQARLQRFQALIETLGLGQMPDAWDRLLAVEELGAQQPVSAARLNTLLPPLVAVAVTPEIAQRALRVVWPHVEAVIQTYDQKELTALQADIVALANRLPLENGPLPSLWAPLLETGREILMRGQVRLAAAFLQFGGRARDRLLLELLNAVLGGGTISKIPMAAPGDRSQLISLFIDGLRLTEKSPQHATLFDRLLVEVFLVAAPEATVLNELWKQIGELLVMPRLMRGEWGAEKQALAKSLAQSLSADRCPEASARINLEQLKALKQLDEPSLLALLKEIAFASARCPEADKRLNEIVRLAKERVPEKNKDKWIVALGHLAEAVWGTAAWDRLFEMYRQAMGSLPSTRQFGFRDGLAEVGLMHVLSQELLAEILPWSEKKGSANKYQIWRKELLEARAWLMDAVRQQVAALVLHQPPERSQGILPFLDVLLLEAHDQPNIEEGWRHLYSAKVLITALEPASLSPFLSSLQETDLTPEAAARLSILKFMRETGQRVGQPDWSVLKFPYGQHVWKQAVRALLPPEKMQILAWCADIFAACGVTQPDEARALVNLVEEAGGDSANIGELMARLLKGHDPVTWVLAIMAFAKWGLEGDTSHNWGIVVGDILRRCDRDTRQLFEKHLALRFSPPGAEYKARLRWLCETAGLPVPQIATLLPEPAPTSSKPVSVPSVPPPGSSATASPALPQPVSAPSVTQSASPAAPASSQPVASPTTASPPASSSSAAPTQPNLSPGASGSPPHTPEQRVVRQAGVKPAESSPPTARPPSRPGDKPK